MPQGKRKVPFSGKAKKQQLQLRKNVKSGVSGRNKPLLVSNLSSDDEERDVQKMNYQPKSSNSRRDLNRYVLQFHKESESELQKRKEEARLELKPVEEENLEVNIDDYFPDELNFPTRPEWDYSMSKQELEAKENRYFSEYIKTLESKFKWKDLSYFELNLETWRQLWRVLEMADIVLIVIDIRFPALMFPPSLYNYVCGTLKKNMIVVLNKVDLAPAPLVVAWKHYFLTKFPDLHVVCFTSLPGYNLRGNTSNRAGLLNRRRKGRLRMAAEGALKLLDACKSIAKDNVDLTCWQEKISEEMNSEYEDDEAVVIGQTIELSEQDTSYVKPDRYSGGVLTIGCVGQPNVGKSSLMNALMGKKVVSVSRTPGHTKHFQTIFLTKNVKLCDCPGLIFPSKVPKQLQVLMGSFPIAQLREPYSAIRYLAERVDLVKLLSLEHPDNDETWSAMDIVDGWAQKKHFYTARAARLDSYRAGNHLLRMALDGKISLCLYPPDYIKSKDTWENHADVEEIQWIQAKTNEHKEIQVAQSVGNSDESDVSEDSAPSSSRRSVSPNRTDESSDDNVKISSNKFGALNPSTP